jgi:leader peptidase (prepilin peptidase)/N-methyltransferase
MGFGDVVLMAMIGSVIGWQPVLVVFFLSPACAIAVILFALLTGAYREFPFGPWLSLATVVLLVGWRWIWPSVGGFFLAGRLIPIMGIGMVILLFVLLRIARMLRGDRYWTELGPEQWTSADQLLYQSQENAGLSRNRLTSNDGHGGWRSLQTGGSHGERRWRSQPASDVRWQLQRKR